MLHGRQISLRTRTAGDAERQNEELNIRVTETVPHITQRSENKTVINTSFEQKPNRVVPYRCEYLVTKWADTISVLSVTGVYKRPMLLSHVRKTPEGEWEVWFRDSLPGNGYSNNNVDRESVPQGSRYKSLDKFLSITKNGPSVDVKITFEDLELSSGAPSDWIWHMSLSFDTQSMRLSAKDSNNSLTTQSVHHGFELIWDKVGDNRLDHDARRRGSLKMNKDDVRGLMQGDTMRKHRFFGQIVLAIVILCDYFEGDTIGVDVIEEHHFKVSESININDAREGIKTSNICFEKEENVSYKFHTKKEEILGYKSFRNGQPTLVSHVRKQGSEWEVWFTDTIPTAGGYGADVQLIERAEAERGCVPPGATYEPLKEFISIKQDGNTSTKKTAVNFSKLRTTFNWFIPPGLTLDREPKTTGSALTDLSVKELFRLTMNTMQDGSQVLYGNFVLSTTYNATTRNSLIDPRKLSEEPILLGQMLLAVVALCHDDIFAAMIN